MEQLSFSVWLLSMATFGWVGVFLLLGLALALFVRGRPGYQPLLLVPIIWLAPIILAGAFVERRGAKTADWLGIVALAVPVAFLVAVPFVVRRLKVPDFLGAAWMVGNGIIVLMTAIVVGMASGGTWL